MGKKCPQWLIAKSFYNNIELQLFEHLKIRQSYLKSTYDENDVELLNTSFQSFESKTILKLIKLKEGEYLIKNIVFFYLHHNISKVNSFNEFLFVSYFLFS